MQRAWLEQTLRLLQPQYEGRYELWVVPVFRGPDNWCARRVGEETSCVVRHSPEELVEALAGLDGLDHKVEPVAKIGRCDACGHLPELPRAASRRHGRK